MLEQIIFTPIKIVFTENKPTIAGCRRSNRRKSGGHTFYRVFRASGALSRKGDAASSTSTGTQPTPNEGVGGLLGGFGGLLDKLQKGGLGNATNSWIGAGQNQPVSPGQLGSALGPVVIKTLAQRSGLSEEEITKQLSQILPGVVDKLTPHGRLPTVAELSRTT